MHAPNRSVTDAYRAAQPECWAV